MDVLEKEGFLAHSLLKSYQKKVADSKEIIKKAIALGNPYVAVSWGKDSTVLLHLVQSIVPDVLAVYHAHVERDLISNYSEVIAQYCDNHKTNLMLIETDNPNEDMKTQSPYETHDVCFLGIRAEENKRRRIAISKFGPIHQYTTGLLKGNYRIAPLAYWKWQDIWAYICANNLPYLKAYDEDLKGKHLSRTTDHISKTLNKSWQKERYDMIALSNENYFNVLKTILSADNE